jgi:hypothetical protein
MRSPSWWAVCNEVHTHVRRQDRLHTVKFTAAANFQAVEGMFGQQLTAKYEVEHARPILVSSV